MIERQLAIVIPTYNEKSNVEKLLPRLIDQFPGSQIFVVDDNSPDGTAESVAEISKQHENVRLILRYKREGMASAYLDAFARIIPDETLQYITTMDADLSHDPEDLEIMIRQLEQYDVVIGSRYIEGGEIENWAWWRHFISHFGAIYTRTVLGADFKDTTTGFAVYRRGVLMKILSDIKPRQPYAFQTEMKYRAQKNGAKIVEVPITFRERTMGKSKLKSTAIIEALFFPWLLRFSV